ncbi:MAG TPA: ribonuclease domain-containing protein [Thermoanaerobaculia bacterium]|nr:ribonuclease domain-containing protein [Thermoanaerobaculia bacterium]
MRRRKPSSLVFLIAALVVIATGWWQQQKASPPTTLPPVTPASSPAGSPASPSAAVPSSLDAVPAAHRPAVEQTLALIRSGGPFPYSRDGITFQNREGKLPQRPSGYYREYTVPTPGAKNRGARRIVQGRDGDTWYTSDHYRTFVRIDE